MNAVDPQALFRLSVLGPLVSRERLERGEFKRLVAELAQREYAIPNSRRHRLGAKTIEAWFYAWRRHGLEGLVPKTRVDSGRSRIEASLQEAIVAAKRDNPRRSTQQILRLLRAQGLPQAQTLSRSAIHRLLQQHGLSKLAGTPGQPEERRSFAAEFAGSIWYGDVMHGPRVPVAGQVRKTYLVSLFDDASRLVAHSAFCLGETALDIEGVLKQALLRRGVPIKLVVDNGAAYRASTLHSLCARLGIHLIFCRPYAPEGKGKLERWHRTVREQFLAELDERRINDLSDLNARLWAWLEQVYHRSEHGGLQGMTPLARYQRDLPRIRSLGARAAQLDALFHHRVQRLVRKDGTVSYLGQRFEVPFELAGRTVKLVVDPHAQRVVGVEDDAGVSLGQATVLDAIANNHRTRRKSTPTDPSLGARQGANLVEIAHAQYHRINDDGINKGA
ncbi:MAG: DDE-type integrase/transposase/recombinase [Burkholderiaceae bacterium]|nr:DDE-type integrase/transposase/recombinase [Burkholderiaceae bacterium]MCU0964727.1 DDE-type integrase/transposase/recombinase [Burkholderiaceae bacterium]